MLCYDRTMKKLLRKLHLKPSKYWLVLFFPVLFCIVAFYIIILHNLPSPTRLSSTSLPQSTQIFDRHDTLLYTIYANKNQTFIPLSSIPLHVQEATIAIEDKDFYTHGAIDLRGIARAAVATFYHGQTQGGSTLTQQLVKNSLLTPERTFTRKIKEVILSFATEVIYSKKQILEMYLNQSPYGGTAYGVEAASQTYFGKSVKDLNLAESALLAGLPEAPSVYSPFGTHPELAKRRQEEILRKMYEQKYISQEEMEDALVEPITFKKVATDIKAPHFVLWIKDILAKKYGQQIVEQGGLKVKTSLDLPLQEFVQDTIASEVAKLKNYHVSNAAVVVTDPATGEILAMQGSKDYFATDIDGNVNVVLANRQPGSSIKPINYAVGLIKGLHAATPFVDQPICFPSPGSKPYCPVNYDGKWHGVVQFRQALGNSLNIPAVKILKYNGLDAMIATASAMGITSFKEPDRYGLSLTLGGGEVTMLEMATAFGVFANQGYRRDLHPILKVTDAHGKVVDEYTPLAKPIFGKRVLPSGVAFIISHILQDNGAREMAFGSNSELKIGNKPVSVKTGTTNDYRDNWTIGYTQSSLVAVWVGNNDNTPMSGLVSGVTGAAPIWHDIMEHMLASRPAQLLVQPNTVVGKHVCATTGKLPPPDGTPNRCPTRFEYFLKGTDPKTTDPARQKVFLDKTTHTVAKPGQTENVEEKEEVIIADPVGDRACATCALAQPSPQP